MRTLLFVLVAALFAAQAAAQTAPPAPAKPESTQEAARAAFEPQTGQSGKDVIWLPTPQVVVDKMLEIAKVTPKDYVIDLGSGDGRTVITAAKMGARALGIEYNPDMVAYSKRQAAAAGVTARARFMKADLFKTSFSQATVITMFLLTDINLKLRPKILALKPGTRIVSNTFEMGEWEPDARADLAGQPGRESSYCKVLHWVVPQKVAGTYRVKQGQVTLKQEFQMLTGSIARDGAIVPLTGRVRGTEIEMTAGDKKYRGRLSGGKLDLREG